MFGKQVCSAALSRSTQSASIISKCFSAMKCRNYFSFHICKSSSIPLTFPPGIPSHSEFLTIEIAIATRKTNENVLFTLDCQSTSDDL
jgi:hypothetical protein